MRFVFVTLTVLASVSALTAQVFQPVPNVRSDDPPVAPAISGAALGSTEASGSESLAPTAAATPSPVSLNGYVPDDKYKLRPGDRVSVQILEDRDAPKSLVVADSGELDFPYIGRVPAADKTCRQLAEDVQMRLTNDYYYRATVIIALDAANKILGRVYLSGQVRNQGPLELVVNDNMTAGRAILRAGGFSDFANKKKVRVIRLTPGSSSPKETFELNMVEIIEDGKVEKDILLEPDDFIYVPSRLISF